MLPTSSPPPTTLLLATLLALPCGVLGQEAEATADTTTGSSYADGHGGEVFFPLGDISFADEVVRFDEGDPAARDEQIRKAENLLGPPDNSLDDVERYLTMGCGGTAVVRFTDNALVDVEGPDLYVFEIGGAVEPTNLAVSVDGEEWMEVGAIGSAARLTLSSGVLFDLDEAVLKPEARQALNELAGRLADFGPSRVTVEGHTDATGSEAYNQDLSRRRARNRRVEVVVRPVGGG